MFSYEDEESDIRKLRMATVLWNDAFSEFGQLEITEAKELLQEGMPVLTTGILVDLEEETIMLAQDLIVPYPMVRNFKKIRKCDVRAMWSSDIDWKEHDDGSFEVLGISNTRPDSTWMEGVCLDTKNTRDVKVIELSALIVDLE